jgi:membrane peptidoglycan carboxypeptidase
MMKHVVKDGTAAGTLSGMRRPAAGKTGTTDRSVDAWFVGFTPQYTAAVWMGNQKGELPWSLGSVYGGTYPAKIWRAFMEAATDKLPPLDFPAPDTAAQPRPSYISEYGRRYSFNFGRRATSPTTVPAVPAPIAPTPTTTGAAVPPSTKAAKPPTTTGSPPTSANGPGP